MLEGTNVLEAFAKYNSFEITMTYRHLVVNIDVLASRRNINEILQRVENMRRREVEEKNKQ